jgi:hypothetical protein
LRYCLYCGGKTLEIEKPSMPADPHCGECGEEDELNVAFCVYCGAKLAVRDALEEAKALVAKASGQQTAQAGAGGGSGGNATQPTIRLQKKTGFNWQAEMNPPPQVRAAMRFEGEPSAAILVSSARGSNDAIPALAGVVGGLLLAGVLFVTGALPYVAARLTWPRSGLVVYCPGAEGTNMQLSLENLDNHTVTLAPVPAKGSALQPGAPRCVIVRGLPKGAYMMRVDKGGTSTAIGMVTLAENGPTVIGYPSGIRMQD